MLLAAFVCALQAKDRNKERISVTRDAKDFSSIHLESVGQVTVNGSAAKADISKEGIGGVNLCGLKVGE